MSDFAASSSATSTDSSPSTSSSSNDANTKILKDLRSVQEKMDVLEKMLHPTDGISMPLSIENDAVLAIVGFLEACQPRMIELIEAASMTSGVLSETVLESVLQCNDQLQKTLEDVETAAANAAAENTTTTSAAAAAATDVTDQFNDLLLGDLDFDDVPAPPPAPAAAAAAKTTGEEDDDAAKQPATIPPSSSNDEFDAFFAERQGS
jgi:hypothetical protein